jgi:hypothetical protein
MQGYAAFAPLFAAILDVQTVAQFQLASCPTRAMGWWAASRNQNARWVGGRHRAIRTRDGLAGGVAQS